MVTLVEKGSIGALLMVEVECEGEGEDEGGIKLER